MIVHNKSISIYTHIAKCRLQCALRNYMTFEGMHLLVSGIWPLRIRQAKPFSIDHFVMKSAPEAAEMEKKTLETLSLAKN